mmetsp:Transcript_43838/g.103656  ORF Transcript_43838/g.103656 Transcript_43838/m.103656 type:complete len:188 (-) Transcript_43838:51-614(-)
MYHKNAGHSWAWPSSSQWGGRQYSQWGQTEGWWSTSAPQWQPNPSAAEWYPDSGSVQGLPWVQQEHITQFYSAPHVQWSGYNAWHDPSAVPHQHEHYQAIPLAPHHQQHRSLPSPSVPYAMAQAPLSRPLAVQSRSNSITSSLVQSDIASLEDDDRIVEAEMIVTNTFIELKERRPSLRRTSSFPLL